VSPIVLRSLWHCVHPLRNAVESCCQPGTQHCAVGLRSRLSSYSGSLLRNDNNLRHAKKSTHLQMRANSDEGIWMVALYSVSGMPSLKRHTCESCPCMQLLLVGACPHAVLMQGTLGVGRAAVERRRTARCRCP
jgi:hypothetical protein